MPNFNEINSVVAQDASQNRWLHFRNPIRIFTTDNLAEVTVQLALVEFEVMHGRYAAGFVNYEAAAAFDNVFPTKQTNSPLIWFAVYEDYEEFDFPPSQYGGQDGRQDDSARNQTALDWSLLVEEKEYQHALKKIKNYIRAGDTYQVNYSFRLKATLPDDEHANDHWDFFVRMVHAQKRINQCGYCVYINTENWTICSASPELFFEYHGRVLKSKPMKGTAPRGLGYSDDMQRGYELQHSAKNRAENIMIADMVRNDMGKIADIGSVQTTDILTLEKYPTFWTMTTTVQCHTDPKLTDIFAALFPAASITGAPKLRAMQIIDQLETHPRHIYTGSAGFVTPHHFAQFNVAIRTVLIDKINQQAEFGVGGGIVWDSESGDEFQECHTKARVLTYSQPQFELLETIKWCATDGYILLEDHLLRLQHSACYFSWSIDANKIAQQLKSAQTDFPNTDQRVRLRVSKSGNIMIEHTDLIDFPDPYVVKVAVRPINSKNYFLYHKTTYRTMYQNMYENTLSASPNCDDVLLYNERGELTESCRANLLIQSAAGWITPPVSCGLLNGIGRQHLIRQGKATESIVNREQLLAAKSVWLVNSVRGRWRVSVTS